jgi:hypothetical protein
MIDGSTGSVLLSVIDDSTAAPPHLPAIAATPDAAAPLSGLRSVSDAVRRFQACRWRKPPEDGSTECCTHRDVLPLTGTRGFDPEAWCPDCRFYKLRRTPKKRPFSDEPFWRP